jgi:hypothetical protein
MNNNVLIEHAINQVYKTLDGLQIDQLMMLEYMEFIDKRLIMKLIREAKYQKTLDISN